MHKTREPTRVAAPSLAMTASSPSHRPDQAQRIINRGMDVARGDRVAYAVELVGAARVRLDRLRTLRDQRGVIDFAEVSRARLQLEIEFVRGLRAVFDDDPIGRLLDPLGAIFVEEMSRPVDCLPGECAPAGD